MGVDFHAWRRFSEFHQLHLDSCLFLERVEETSSRKLKDKFPPKSSLSQLLSGADKKDDFLHSRKQLLTEYCEVYLAHLEPATAQRLMLRARSFFKLPSGAVKQICFSTTAASFSSMSLLPQQQLEQDPEPQVLLDSARSATEALLTQLRQAEEQQDGWKKYTQRRGVDIYLKQAGALSFSVGVGRIEAPMYVVVDFFVNPETRRLYDDMFKCEQDLQVVDRELLPSWPELPGSPTLNFVTVRHMEFKAPAPFLAPRDNVSVYAVSKQEDDTLVIALKSVTHPRCPVSSKYVRADVLAAGITLKEVEPGVCVLKKLEGVDPNGDLPKFVTSAIGPERAMMIDLVARLIKKNKSKWPPPPSQEQIDNFVEANFARIKARAAASAGNGDK